MAQRQYLVAPFLRVAGRTKPGKYVYLKWAYG